MLRHTTLFLYQTIGRFSRFSEYSADRNQLSEPFMASFDFCLLINDAAKQENQRVCYKNNPAYTSNSLYSSQIYKKN